MLPLRFTRRTFHKTTLAGAVAGPAILARRSGAVPATERITVGMIGIGVMCRGHLGRFLGYPDTQVVAACDVVRQRLEDAVARVDKHYTDRRSKGSFRGCLAFTDFRQLLDAPDIDAVVIATPDHWHTIPCLMAARRGKHIYCEKPLTLTIGEGRTLVETVRQHQVILQTGSQQRSEFGGRFRRAVELVRNGHIGEVQTIRVGVGDPAVPCDLPTQTVPAGTNWEFWLGPAPQRGYHQELCPPGVHAKFPAWRRYREFAGGGLSDMGAHHFDIAQWALGMDRSGPVRIDPPEGEATRGLRFTYQNGVEMWHGGPSGCTFEGTTGTLWVDRPHLKSDPQEIVQREIGANDIRVVQSTNHARDWIDAIHDRRQPICDAEIGHRSASICHLANIGYQLRRPLRWDPQAEQFLDDPGANQLLHREPREPWRL